MHTDPTHLPVPGAKIELLSHHLGAVFFPKVRLDKKAGHMFAGSLSEYLDTHQTTVESDHWHLVSDYMEVKVAQGELLISSKKQQQWEWYETRHQVILNRFSENFKPKMILGSKVLLRGLLAIDGDARNFIGERIMDFPPAKIRRFNRPLHVLGVRMMFPPFEAQATNKETGEVETLQEEKWGLDVKIESWMKDPSKLFVEAELKWDDPQPWTNDSPSEVVGRVQFSEEFLNNTLLPFLQDNSAQLDS